MTGAGLVAAAVAFAVAGFGQHHILLLALAAVLLDMAVQITLILGHSSAPRSPSWPSSAGPRNTEPRTARPDRRGPRSRRCAPSPMK